MKQKEQIKYLKDYQQPNYWVSNLSLKFEIMADYVLVTNSALYVQNKSKNNSLILNGSSELMSLKFNDENTTAYNLDNDELLLNNLPEKFTLEIVTKVDPFHNKSCMGLYASNGNLFTQNEPEGFRKITYYQDRSDVMTKFTTTIIGDKDLYPIMLSNGNKISERQLDNNLHEVIWEDPFNKPSYLFALVAGKFSVINDNFITKSGREVLLEVYSEAESINQCQHCMDSVKRAMKWDEDRFNLEYDLDRYMIVASGDFNMGAMENKGLNIFNTKYVLAESKTATDTDFINVEAVVGHEYFHNWTGNRVTCRDWFQLSLKEGLTVFRDQEFTSDLHSRAVKRIQDVRTLRQNQFPEDASPLAHPVRPASYMEINNFYTVTIYEKGAEVVRMYQTLLGKTGFNKGMALYISRHDGEAATCDNFCAAMADANNFDLSQFMLWYSQAGTPILNITDNYDELSKVYRIDIIQQIPDTPDITNKQPMLIPVSFGLLSESGHSLPFEIISGNIIKPNNNHIMLVTNQTNSFELKVSEKPTPSLLREFSAPVILNYAYSDSQLINIAAHDTDTFNRWEAMQNLYKKEIMAVYNDENYILSDNLVTALVKSLDDDKLDPSMKNLMTGLPNFAELSAQYKPVDAHKLLNAIQLVKNFLANKLEQKWLKAFEQCQTSSYNFNDSGKRALKNSALSYLMAGNNSNIYLNIAELQFRNSDNMTDKIGALSAINDSYDSLREELLGEFCTVYKQYPLVMDKWFTLQAQSQRNDTLDRVKLLTLHDQFDNQNPNKLYSLVRSFSANAKVFNTIDGYQWIADEILRIDKFNSGVAGRIANSFGILNSLSDEYKNLAKPALEKILAETQLSKDVYELISKTYNQL